MWTFYSNFYDIIMFWDCLFIFFQQQMVSQQRILIHEDSMNLLSLYTSPSLPNITLGLPAVPTQLNVSHYTATWGILLEGNPSCISHIFRLQGNLVEFASPRIHTLHSELCRDVQFDFKLKNYTGSTVSTTYKNNN